MITKELIDELTAGLDLKPAETEGDNYVMYLSPRACWNLRTWGIQKRAKRGYFNLKRDLHKFYPLPETPAGGN